MQLGIDHWFYLYIPWFFPLVMIALLGAHPPGRFGVPLTRETGPAESRTEGFFARFPGEGLVAVERS